MATVGTQQQIPPLPPDTAGRWLDVVRENEVLVRRWLNVMYQMDSRYLREGFLRFCHGPGHRPAPDGASYYYWSNDQEVVVRLALPTYRKQHQVLSVGFVGSISPQAALDLVVDKCIDYARERNINSVFAVAPRRMDNPRILELYALVPNHRRLRVRVERESVGAVRWRISFPEFAS